MKAAYCPSWLSSSSPVSTIDTSYFTHFFYAFLTPDPVSYELTVSESDSPLLSSFTTTLHHKNPPVKNLLSIAGDHAIFARMATKASSTPQLRLDGNTDSMDWISIGSSPKALKRWNGRPRCPSGGVAARAHKRSHLAVASRLG